MDVEATCDAIQTLVAGSSLINKTPAISEWPESIDDGDMPMALTCPGTATWEGGTFGTDVRKGKYITNVYVQAKGLGLVLEGIALTLDIISDVGARLAAATNLGSVVGGQTVKDKGLVLLKMNDTEYRGTSFEVEIEEDV